MKQMWESTLVDQASAVQALSRKVRDISTCVLERKHSITNLGSSLSPKQRRKNSKPGQKQNPRENPGGGGECIYSDVMSPKGPLEGPLEGPLVAKEPSGPERQAPAGVGSAAAGGTAGSTAGGDATSSAVSRAVITTAGPISQPQRDSRLKPTGGSNSSDHRTLPPISPPQSRDDREPRLKPIGGPISPLGPPVGPSGALHRPSGDNAAVPLPSTNPQGLSRNTPLPPLNVSNPPPGATSTSPAHAQPESLPDKG